MLKISSPHLILIGTDSTEFEMTPLRAEGILNIISDQKDQLGSMI